MTAAAYQNELENAFGQLPGWLQSPLRPIFEKFDEGLHWVAGNPDDLLRAGQVYVQLGQQIQQLTEQQKADRAKLAGHWEGDSYEAFTSKMQEIEGQLGTLSQATSKTQEVLQAAAQACVEGANMVIEIVTALIMWLISTIVVNAALSVLTFGLSLAAEVAEAIAGAVASLARVATVIEKVAQVLEKIAQVLKKIADIIKKIVELLKKLEGLLKQLKTWSKEASMFKQPLSWAGRKAVNGAVNYGVSKGASAVTGGLDSPPGMVGSGIKAGEDYKGAWDAADKAEQAAE
ncbi:MAG TPA: WXG100 family type VII secretion target [Streptosporangiaceae bacterium]